MEGNIILPIRAIEIETLCLFIIATSEEVKASASSSTIFTNVGGVNHSVYVRW